MSQMIPLFQVDAFTSRLFGGNPAAVCPLEKWLPDSVLQSIALENNLSETAFFAPEGDGYRLRWFTPAAEVELCGHATLATAHVLFTRLGFAGERIHFLSRSGDLFVARQGDRLCLDFPAHKPIATPEPEGLSRALGKSPVRFLAWKDYWMALYDSERDVATMSPDFPVLAAICEHGVIVTARGSDCDFVSRFFAPALAINEDPVTGSAHTVLTPYWGEQLGKTVLHARQLSQRRGELFCELVGDRVSIAGHAVTYLEGGHIRLP